MIVFHQKTELMKRLLKLFFLTLLLSCTKDDGFVPGPKTFAAADIYSITTEDGENYVSGEWVGNVSFAYQDGVTKMEVSISNFEPDGSHAMHLHMGSLETPGRHWNQNTLANNFCNARSLGEVWAKPFAGDVGNISVDSEGNGSFTLETDLWTLGQGLDSDIEGTVLFIHEEKENFLNECDPNHQHQHGHTNEKIAGGTVVLGSQILQ